MNKKIIGMLAIAIFAFSMAAVLSDTWVDKAAPFTFNSIQNGSNVSIGLFSDCALTTPIATTGVAHDFGLVAQGNTYEWTLYVVNNGANQVYLTYAPTTYSANGGQTAGTIAVQAIAYGVACETSGTTLAPPLAANALPYNLPEKSTSHPSAGFLLMPNKVVKLDVKLTITSVDAGLTFTVPFMIAGCNVVIQG